MTQSVMELQVGAVLEGRYALEQFLGQGGFARVWRAMDQQLGRQVAVKILNVQQMMGHDGMMATVLQRFEREAKLAASIHHPNVVQIHDIGHIGGVLEQPFIVMELLDGKDLKEAIDQDGPCDPATFIPRFIDCLDGLARAHERGIIHKDLKPSNLFLSDPGRRTEALKVVDFGIAHINQPSIEGAGRLTSTGQLLGTPQYLPPEYIHGQHVSAAMDVYQMCLILVEALSAEYMLGEESSLQCLIIHGDGRLEVPTYLMQSPLGEVLRRGLSRDVRTRYQDAGELADALASVDVSAIPQKPPHERGQLLPRQRLDGSPAEPRVTRSAASTIDTGHPPMPSQRAPSHAKEAYYPTEAHPSLAGGVKHEVIPTYYPPVPTKQGMSSGNFGALLILLILFGGVAVVGLCVLGAVLGEDESSESVVSAVSPNLEQVEFEDVVTEPPLIAQAREEFEELDDLEEPDEPDPQGEVGLEQLNEAAVALEVEEASQVLEAGKKDEAIKMCEGIIKEVDGRTMEVLGCYNVIMRASWNPTRKFGAREARGCDLLKGYEEAYEDHRISIGIQRQIMKCVEHDH